jgi:hypothetical protein
MLYQQLAIGFGIIVLSVFIIRSGIKNRKEESEYWENQINKKWYNGMYERNYHVMRILGGIVFLLVGLSVIYNEIAYVRGWDTLPEFFPR